MHTLAYLRRERRAAGISLHELGNMAGGLERSQLSRIERGERPPTFALLLVCQILFELPSHKLFPRAFDEIEERVVRQAYLLHEDLEKVKGPRAAVKREFLAGVIHRASQRP